MATFRRSFGGDISSFSEAHFIIYRGNGACLGGPGGNKSLRTQNHVFFHNLRILVKHLKIKLSKPRRYLLNLSSLQQAHGMTHFTMLSAPPFSPQAKAGERSLLPTRRGVVCCSRSCQDVLLSCSNKWVRVATYSALQTIYKNSCAKEMWSIHLLRHLLNSYSIAWKQYQQHVAMVALNLKAWSEGFCHCTCRERRNSASINRVWDLQWESGSTFGLLKIAGSHKDARQSRRRGELSSSYGNKDCTSIEQPKQDNIVSVSVQATFLQKCKTLFML